MDSSHYLDNSLVIFGIYLVAEKDAVLYRENVLGTHYHISEPQKVLRNQLISHDFAIHVKRKPSLSFSSVNSSSCIMSRQARVGELRRFLKNQLPPLALRCLITNWVCRRSDRYLQF